MQQAHNIQSRLEEDELWGGRCPGRKMNWRVTQCIWPWGKWYKRIKLTNYRRSILGLFPVFYFDDSGYNLYMSFPTCIGKNCRLDSWKEIARCIFLPSVILHILFHRGCTILHSHQHCIRVSVSPQSIFSSFWIFACLIDEVVSHCRVNLHFLSEVEHLFHMFKGVICLFLVCLYPLPIFSSQFSRSSLRD